VTRQLGEHPPTAEEPVDANRPSGLQRFIISRRWWFRWKYEEITLWFNSVQRNRFFTVGFLWALTIIGNLLLLPNVGLVLLLATVGAAVVRSGLNPFTTTVVFVIAIFVIPARYAFLGMSLSMAIGLGAFLLWFFHRMQNGAIPGERPHRMDRWILIFFAAKVLAYANAQLHFRSDKLVANADRQIIVFLAYAGIALYVSEVAKDQRLMHRLVNLLIFGAAFMSITAIVEQQTGLDVARYLRPPGFTVGGRLDGEGATLAPERFGVRRAFGSATGPLEYTTMILAVLPLAVHRAVYGRDKRERRYGTIMAFIIIVGLPMSVSRTSVVGLFLALILIGLGLRSPERRRLAAGFGVTMLFLLVTFSAVSSAFLQLTTSFFAAESSTTLQVAGRTGDYEIVGSLFMDRPILGTGLASSDPTVPRLVDGQRIRNLYLDNQYLSEMLTGGIVGLLALLGLIGAGIGAARRARAIAANPVDANLAYSVAASIMIMGLTFAFFDALSFRSTTGLFFVLLGLAGALEANVLSFDPTSNRARIGDLGTSHDDQDLSRQP
jgi:O-antigen ligase